ncbi:hypothetical protein EDD15DRAFT_2361491 [Pisolithus albus]|nr:hypothetical protein EDD15DRAFT_2361491 [Pisolithus albus]
MSKPTSSENIVNEKAGENVFIFTVQSTYNHYSTTGVVGISRIPAFTTTETLYNHAIVADLLVKAGVGFGVGVVASVILFRRRTWPVALSTGFGMGAAYADCDRLFNPARIPGTRIITQAEEGNK